MAPTPPFVDPESGHVSVERLLEEAIPLAELIGAFVLVTFVPFVLQFLGVFAGFFALLSQFVLAVGTGVVAIYVLVRAVQLAGALEGGVTIAGDTDDGGADSEREATSD